MTLRHLSNRNVENSFYNLKIGLFDTYTCITKFGGSEYHIIPNFNFHFKKVIKLSAIVRKKKSEYSYLPIMQLYVDT